MDDDDDDGDDDGGEDWKLIIANRVTIVARNCLQQSPIHIR